jgi:hypothetical protein
MRCSYTTQCLLHHVILVSSSAAALRQLGSRVFCSPSGNCQARSVASICIERYCLHEHMNSFQCSAIESSQLRARAQYCKGLYMSPGPDLKSRHDDDNTATAYTVLKSNNFPLCCNCGLFQLALSASESRREAAHRWRRDDTPYVPHSSAMLVTSILKLFTASLQEPDSRSFTR